MLQNICAKMSYRKVKIKSNKIVYEYIVFSVTTVKKLPYWWLHCCQRYNRVKCNLAWIWQFSESNPFPLVFPLFYFLKKGHNFTKKGSFWYNYSSLKVKYSYKATAAALADTFIIMIVWFSQFLQKIKIKQDSCFWYFWWHFIANHTVELK